MIFVLFFSWHYEKKKTFTQATDVDTVGGPVSFTLSGNKANLWTVTPLGNNQANITAVRPILYEDAPNVQTGRSVEVTQFYILLLKSTSVF